MMTVDYATHLDEKPLEVSVPCRIDMGGTLDITTFHYPLRHLKPCTFNIATGLRTYVRFYPFQKGRIKVSSRGFESVEFRLKEAPFNHPLGLMLAIAAYFGAEGIHIDIHSGSPPRSAMGGSSSAAVALVAGLLKIAEGGDAESISRDRIALLAHSLESSVAGVPCGMQDQLAAVYGGVNAWYWNADVGGLPYRKYPVVKEPVFKDLEQHMLLAYCGMPHESSNINGKWVKQFLDGQYRGEWEEIAACTHRFVDAVAGSDFQAAVALMNRETGIRRMMTPDVLDDMGKKLVDCAASHHCGARFTGAGGGGCVWALGERKNIRHLRPLWEQLLAEKEEAQLLDFTIDPYGLIIHE